MRYFQYQLWGWPLSILKVSIRQIKAARALLAWSQEQMAGNSGVSIPTVKRLESADGALGGRSDTVKKIIEALEAAGVEFTNGGTPGVRMYKPMKLIGEFRKIAAANQPITTSAGHAKVAFTALLDEMKTFNKNENYPTEHLRIQLQELFSFLRGQQAQEHLGAMRELCETASEWTREELARLK
jgi:transcriptional regulator with XRE-family HTH domain